MDRVVELWRGTYKIICLKIELDGVMLNVLSAYAPQVGGIREVRTGLRKMNKGKAQGPDDIPVGVWITQGNKSVEFLVNLFRRLLQWEKMPGECRRSVLVPL